jgi:hypothetical protein
VTSRRLYLVPVTTSFPAWSAETQR